MALLVRLDEGIPSDELRSLHSWLLEEDELRGCVQEIQAAPAPDRLGSALEAVRIVADPAAAVFTGVLLAWLKTRVGRVRITVTSDRGELFTLDATQVRGLDPTAISELGERLMRAAQEAAPSPSSVASVISLPAAGQVVEGSPSRS